MKNKAFTRKSTAEKRRYLSAVLRFASGGALDDAMIGRILLKVAIHRQYNVSVFSDASSFQKAVACDKPGNTSLPVVHSRTGNGSAAAVTAPLKSALPEKSKRAIYIYSPNLYNRKGANKWVRATKNG